VLLRRVPRHKTQLLSSLTKHSRVIVTHHNPSAFILVDAATLPVIIFVDATQQQPPQPQPALNPRRPLIVVVNDDQLHDATTL
jgi:hypothetical protein